MHDRNLSQLLAMVLFPALAALLLASFQAYQQHHRDIEARMTRVSRTMLLNLEHEYRALAESLTILAMSSDELDRGDFAGFRLKALAVRDSLQVDAIVLTDPDGQQRVNTYLAADAALPRTNNMARIEAVVSEGQPRVSNLLMGTVIKKPLITIDVPVLRGGRVIQVLNAVLLSERLKEIPRVQTLPPGWIAALLDSSGQILTQSGYPAGADGNRLTEQLRSAVNRHASQGVVHLDYQGADVAFSRSAETGHLAALILPRSVLFELSLPHLLLLVAPGILAILASLFLARRLSRSIEAPLKQLSAATEAFARGEAGAALPDSGPRAIRDLTRRFAAMQSALRESETARDQAEADLREQLRFAEGIVDTARAIILVLDQNCRVLRYNHYFQELSGAALTEAAGAEWCERFTPVTERAATRAWFHLALAEAPTMRDRHPIIARDGQTRLIEWRTQPLRDDAGAAIGLICVGIDITERQAIQERLAQSEARFRTLFEAVEQSPDSIVITDTQARIEYVNQSFQRLTGYRAEEVQGRNPSLLKSGHTPQATFSALWSALSQGHSWKGEFHNRRKDGCEYVDFAIVTPIRQSDGRISHFVAIQEDISEKKRNALELDAHRHHLEELVQLRTNELEEARRRADAANAAKSRFLANMSHEIRTPLNAIVGFTHLLRRSPLEAAQHERLGKIDAAAHHLLSIINDILDLSKIESGRMQLEETDFALQDVLGAVRDLIAESAAGKGLRLEVETDAVPAWLRGDPTRLRQGLLNYAGNAVKFTERGNVTLRARLEREEAGDLQVRFEVEDSGVGIAPENLERLFEAFEQADASTTRKYGGSGLGLAITRRLALMMGGEAGASSRPGQGSLFWFSVRLRHGQSEPPKAAVQERHDSLHELRQRHTGARVLLAEDNPINQEVAVEMLHDAGLITDCAENGQIALEMAQANAYDLILMDMQMPVMDGLAATRAIRAQSGFAQTPIIALSGNVFEEDRRVCLDAGMNDFIPKPFIPEQLYSALLRWLTQHKG